MHQSITALNCNFLKEVAIYYSVAFRIGQLLLAEELRQKIANESGIVQFRKPLGFIWPDINFGWGTNISHGEEKEQTESCAATCDQESNNTTAEDLLASGDSPNVKRDHPNVNETGDAAVSDVEKLEYKKEATKAADTKSNSEQCNGGDSLNNTASK